jgi:hypothetical protein
MSDTGNDRDREGNLPHDTSSRRESPSVAGEQREENTGENEQRRYTDPHGNQTLREPAGGSGAGHSRGDESSYLPPEQGENARNPNADSGPINPTPGADAHRQPAEGGRDEYGA